MVFKRYFFFLFILCNLFGGCIPTDPSPFSVPSTSETINQLSSARAIVSNDPNAIYHDVQSALNAGEINILVKNGVYYVNDTIQVSADNVFIEGESATGAVIIQQSMGKDLLAISGNNVMIKNLTLDTQSFQAQAAVVEQGVSGLTIEGNIIYGGGNTFTVFFAGPSSVTAGLQTLMAYRDNHLSNNNKFINNTVTCDTTFTGDAVSFSLQSNGIVSDNRLNGCMLAVYMTRDSQVKGNLIEHSPNHSIYVSLPTENLIVSDNKLIDSTYSGINITPQGEHPYHSINSNNILISDNLIVANFNGIGIDGFRNNFQITSSEDESFSEDGLLKNVKVESNEISIPDYVGIYVIKSDLVDLINNKINFRDCDIASRQIIYATTTYPSSASSGISLELLVRAANVQGNNIQKLKSCMFSEVAYSAVSIGLDSVSDSTVANNNFANFFDQWKIGTNGIYVNQNAQNIQIGQNINYETP